MADYQAATSLLSIYTHLDSQLYNEVCCHNLLVMSPDADTAHFNNQPLACIRPGYDKTSPARDASYSQAVSQAAEAHLSKTTICITSLNQTPKQRKRSPNRPAYTNDERNVFQSHQGQSGPEQDARARSEPESGFAEGSQSIESGGAASGGAALGGCLPIISGLRRRVSRVKLKIKRSWDPFEVPRPFGSVAQGESWIPDHMWLPTRQLQVVGSLDHVI